MKNKNKRLDTIRLILSTHEVGSQEELLKALSQEGFSLTQATLSRDLRQLRVVKTVGAQGRYKYALTQPVQYKRMGTDEEMHPVALANEDYGFISIKFSHNMAVIRTRPSYAGPLAYRIDNFNFPEVLGTLAGDDTVMLVMSEEATKSDLLKSLRSILPSM